MTDIVNQSQDNLVPMKPDYVLDRSNPGQSISIMNLQDDDSMYVLDHLAAEIWKCIDGQSTLSQIAAAIMKTHSPPKAQFQKDFVKLIEDLKKERLIELH